MKSSFFMKISNKRVKKVPYFFNLKDSFGAPMLILHQSKLSTNIRSLSKSKEHIKKSKGVEKYIALYFHDVIIFYDAFIFYYKSVPNNSRTPEFLSRQKISEWYGYKVFPT